MGRRRLVMLSQLRPTAVTAGFSERCEAGLAAGHQVVVSGIQMADGPEDAALAAYYYQSLAAMCGAALKLIRIGQEGCQRVLSEQLGRAEEVVAGSKRVERERAGWFNPLLEIASMRHAVAGERLFIS